MNYTLTYLTFATVFFCLSCTNSNSNSNDNGSSLKAIETGETQAFPKWMKKKWPKILSASFEYDNKVPKSAEKWAKGVEGKDGILLTLSHEIDVNTLNPSDFLVETSQKTKYTPEIATIEPANEYFEKRAIWLYGLMGNSLNAPPKTISIVDELKSIDGQNYKGEKVEVAPINALPKIERAEWFNYDSNYPYKSSGAGCDCPKGKTKKVIQLMWSSNIKSIKGEPITDNILSNFKVLARTPSKFEAFTPFSFGDLNDDDNFIDLCLDIDCEPLMVEVAENVVMDDWRYANKAIKTQIHKRWD